MYPANADYELRRVRTQDEWVAYHKIREDVLWTARGLSGYRSDHPDEHRSNFEPLILYFLSTPIGTARLDYASPDTAMVRLVAIRSDMQRRGHGRVLLTLVESRARERGFIALQVASAPDAARFYQEAGYELIHNSNANPILRKKLS